MNKQTYILYNKNTYLVKITVVSPNQPESLNDFLLVFNVSSRLFKSNNNIFKQVSI